jgi:hypothetical protein
MLETGGCDVRRDEALGMLVATGFLVRGLRKSMEFGDCEVRNQRMSLGKDCDSRRMRRRDCERSGKWKRQGNQGENPLACRTAVNCQRKPFREALIEIT